MLALMQETQTDHIQVYLIDLLFKSSSLFFFLALDENDVFYHSPKARVKVDSSLAWQIDTGHDEKA